VQRGLHHRRALHQVEHVEQVKEVGGVLREYDEVPEHGEGRTLR
jgi:Cu/Ag efflux pump CusA